MEIVLGRPWALLLWPVLAVLVLWLARRVRSLGRRLTALAIRLAMITLLVLALAEPGRQASAESERLIILLDRSASVDEAALAQAQAALAAAHYPAPETLIVDFAERPQVIPDPAGEWPEAVGRDRATDIEAALDFAGQLLAGGEGSILLISDGAATAGNPLRAAAALAGDGHAVDVWPLNAAPFLVDVGVEAVQAPPGLWTGQPFSITVSLYSVSPLPATLSFYRDGDLLAEASLELAQGETHVAFSDVAGVQGLFAYEARVSARPDGLDARPQNDVGGAVAVVQPPPSVLIVAQHTAAGERLQAALAASGLPAVVGSPAELPRTVDALLPYQVLILEDVSAETLGIEALKAVEAFTFAHGRGLIVAGGQSAFTLGAYQATPLENMLPVELEPPRRNERPPASLLLILDRSGSMVQTGAGPTKLALAQDAAMRAVETLQPDDHLGVLVFDTSYDWQIPLSTLGQGLSLRDALDRISQISAGGGTDMVQPLQIGIEQLALQPTERKHIVLLSDGQSAEGVPADYQTLIAQATAAGITVSTIAIGDDADRALMADIAEWGRGRYHFASAPEDVPRMMLVESQAVESDAIQSGTIQPRIQQAHSLVSSFNDASFPPIESYVALSPRPEADTVLVSPLGDPLLAAWQYGLGRVVVWTSDLDGEWTPAWSGWPDFARFWAQAVRYALPDPSQGALFAQAVTVGDEVTVRLLAAGDDGRGINLAAGQLSFADRDGSVSQVDLPQTAPGEYVAAFSVAEPGAYRALITLRKEGLRWQTPMGFVVGYPPEHSPRVPPGEALLNQIAAVTGGRVVAGLDEITPPQPAAIVQDRFALWLVAAALLFWPIEIAIRRQWVPWPRT